jgi:hypothetical protein
MSLLGSNSRGLPNLEHWGKERRWDYTRENGEYEGYGGATNGVINALALPPGGISRGLFIGAVRGPVKMSKRPLQLPRLH